MTKLSEVFDIFLIKSSPTRLLSGKYTKEEIEDILFDYFKIAKGKFRVCENNLNILEDPSTGEKYFENDLISDEIDILSTLMVVEYLRPIMISDDVTKQKLSDKDFKVTSQANQLKELRMLYKSMISEANKLITQYTYRELGDEK